MHSTHTWNGQVGTDEDDDSGLQDHVDVVRDDVDEWQKREDE